MRTYLVPIDFSEVSAHTAEFTAALSKHTLVEHIILLNAYYVSEYETMLPNPDMVLLRDEDIEQEAADRIKKLQHLKNKLSKLVRPGVEISIHLNRSHLLRGVIENIAAKDVDLVILGSHGNSSTGDDSHIGSHVVKIAKASPVPVLIVPPAFDFEGIKQVVVACDFKKVDDPIPIEGLKRLLDRTKSKLLAVNVGKEAILNEDDAELKARETSLYAMLEDYHPKYYYINNPNIINGILQFAADNAAQLVVALPRRYSFLQSLVHNSISEGLAENAAVPVLLLK